MKIVLYIIPFIMLSCNSKKIAQITFDVSEINFKIKKGGSIIAKYTFINTGNASLKLISANGDCNCTQIKFPKTPIAPNSKGEISVTYNSAKDTIGSVSRAILVETNTTPILNTLFLKGIIE